MGYEIAVFLSGTTKRSKMGESISKRESATETWFTRRGGFGRNHRAVDSTRCIGWLYVQTFRVIARLGKARVKTLRIRVGHRSVWIG